MSPRLAHYKMNPVCVPDNLSRTIWDEICSIFLCFVSLMLRKDFAQTAPANTAELMVNLQTRNIYLTSRWPSTLLMPEHRSNPNIATAFDKASSTIFGGDSLFPPAHANSFVWWDDMRRIFDSFLAEQWHPQTLIENACRESVQSRVGRMGGEEGMYLARLSW